MSEANFQISEKLTDTAIFVVRGEDYIDFSNNITAVAEDKDFRKDMGAFIEQVTGRSMLSMEQAQQNVVNAFPQAQPARQQQAPQQQQQGGNNFSCDHGQRTFKEGRSKNGGTWSAYFCPQKGSGCKPMNPNGSYWD